MPRTFLAFAHLLPAVSGDVANFRAFVHADGPASGQPVHLPAASQCPQAERVEVIKPQTVGIEYGQGVQHAVAELPCGVDGIVSALDGATVVGRCASPEPQYGLGVYLVT